MWTRRDQIFRIVKRLDRDNLITCPPSLKTMCKVSFQRPGVCFPCPQGSSFENNKEDMETHRRKGDHSRLGGGGSNSDLSSANGNGWKPATLWQRVLSLERAHSAY
ncbi:hypothetical protein TWF128_001393 [Orbilia oligospora]|nr:hypothetical protein TWF128_001393 [Orbilia oligospora]